LAALNPSFLTWYRPSMKSLLMLSCLSLELTGKLAGKKSEKEVTFDNLF